MFYLVGAFTDEVPATPDINEVTRDECTVPPNKYLFFPIINVTADNTGPPSGDFFAPNEGAQRDTAALFANLFDVASLGVTVDGTAVENLGDFRAQSPSFNFTLPPKNILGVAPKRAGLYFAVTDGYWIMLEPLSSGEHIINFNGDFVVDGKVEFGLDVTYNLVVE